MQKALNLPLDTTALEMFRSVGILSKNEAVPPHLELFASQTDRVLHNVRDLVARREMSNDQAVGFQQLVIDCCAVVMCHPIIADNLYLARFAEGVTFDQARHEIQQFSVFGLQFDVAQAQLVANAPTKESYSERLKVLLNEKGIPYKDGFEGELTGRWSPATIHFSWMETTARGLELTFEDLGKIWIGQPGTKSFVDATFKYYANNDQNTALGASFAIENWAANALWTPWIDGMKKLNSTLDKPVDLGYLTYHQAQEEHHSQATLDELLENYRQPWFDTAPFLAGANAILCDGVQAYYESQLASLPDKDDSWPSRCCGPRQFEQHTLPRLNRQKVSA